MKPLAAQVPQEVLSLHGELKKAGFESYLVGGCVRDLLLEKVPQDWDITTNATPEQIQSLFPETFYENEFGTVGVVTQSQDPRLKVVEITPYRIEGKYTNARHPDEVKFSDRLEDDLRRRDFTINAIAYDPAIEKLVDLHGGQEDLKRRLINAVGNPEERFSEDALRMLRAIRLSAELDFTVEAKTLAGIAANASQLEKISRERVRDELLRTLQSPRPMQALFMAQKLGILKYIIPEIEKGLGVDQNQAHSFDVFEHSMRSLQHAADKEWPITVRLAALLHDIGKPRVREWSDAKKDWTFHGHDVVGARMVKKILEGLKFPRETIDLAERLVRWHMFFSDPEKVTLSAVRRLINNVGREHIDELINLRICDRIGTGRPKEQPFRLRKYQSMIAQALQDPISVGMLAIDGKRVMDVTREKPGPRVGWILHALLEEVLDDPAKNTVEYLEKKVVELAALPQEKLQAKGEGGKEKKEEAQEEEIKEIRKKYFVD